MKLKVITKTKLLFFISFLLVFTGKELLAEERSENIVLQDTTKAEVDSTNTVKKVVKSDTYVSGSVRWKNDDGDKSVNFDLRFGINLVGEVDEVDIKIDAGYLSKKDAPDDNEQNARINWYHDIYKNIYGAGQGRIERNQRSYLEIRFDYAILLGGVGAGYNFRTKKNGGSRLSFLYNHLELLLLSGEGNIHSNAPSIYIDNNYKLSEKLSIRNWTTILFWGKNDVGYEIETEMGYSITKNLALGIRHYFLKNGPTLQHNETSELKIYTKITF